MSVWTVQKTAIRLIFGLVVCAQVGCGTIREKRATDQLLLSDAVDRSIAGIDFSPLAHETVFLDPRFLQFKNDSAVTTNYVISSFRQQMIVSGCQLQDRMDDAKYVVEARIGTLAADGYDINYGVPASNTVNAAASIFSGAPPLPAMPEISLAKRTDDMAAVKIAAFAYDRESREPVWQSGNSLAKSEASGLWVLGAGPFKRGSIYNGTQFVGRQKIRGFRASKERTDLNASDLVFRGTSTWDAKLREKVQSGMHLVPPANQEPEEEPTGEVATKDTPDVQ